MTNSHTGFSLTELLIALAIGAILLAVALPSYQSSSIKTRRSEGHSMLLEAAQLQERHFSEYGRYATTLQNSGIPDADTLIIPQISENGFYSLSSNSLTEYTFELTAVPQGGQTDDPCGTLSLTNTGIKGNSNAEPNCW